MNYIEDQKHIHVKTCVYIDNISYTTTDFIISKLNKTFCVIFSRRNSNSVNVKSKKKNEKIRKRKIERRVIIKFNYMIFRK